MTWLIVEDEEDIRNIVSFMCIAWGHQTLTFPDGGKAVEWLEQVENDSYTDDLPELALLDIRMPGYTGDVVGGRIRQTKKLKDIAIVMMTAYSLTESERHRIMTTSGADGLIMKPLPDMDVLKVRLHSILEEKKAGPSSPEG